jgi:hypothetical protein
MGLARMIIVASPQSTSASAPAGWICGTNASPAIPSSRRRARTWRRTVTSATPAPRSSTSRRQIRRALWRCLGGAARSARSRLQHLSVLDGPVRPR